MDGPCFSVRAPRSAISDSVTSLLRCRYVGNSVNYPYSTQHPSPNTHEWSSDDTDGGVIVIRPR